MICDLILRKKNSPAIVSGGSKQTLSLEDLADYLTEVNESSSKHLQSLEYQAFKIQS
jgi:ATP:corrinoid adenosyltransferase